MQCNDAVGSEFFISLYTIWICLIECVINRNLIRLNNEIFRYIKLEICEMKISKFYWNFLFYKYDI